MGVYVGLDIGGTKCAVALGALEGEKMRILAREGTLARGEVVIDGR